MSSQCLRAASVVKKLSSPLGDSPEEAGSHSCVLLESIVSVLGSAWVQVSKDKGGQGKGEGDIKKIEGDLAIPVAAGADPSSST